jgi:hypothetical protein
MNATVQTATAQPEIRSQIKEACIAHVLALRQADQARTDFAAVESDLEFIMAQLARVPTRRDLAKAALGIIISTAALVIL